MVRIIVFNNNYTVVKSCQTCSKVYNRKTFTERKDAYLYINTHIELVGKKFFCDDCYEIEVSRFAVQ